MQTIAAKIKKILDKAASTNHAGEATALMEVARRLMEKHQIEAWEVDTASDPIGSTMTAFYQSGPSSYKPMIRRALAKLYGCKVVRVRRLNFSSKYKLGFAEGFMDDLMGPESARITTELMLDYVWKQVGREASKLAKEGHGKRDALVREIANALNTRIRLMLKTEKPAAPEGDTPNALVVIGSAVAALRDARYPTLNSGRLTYRRSSHAAREAAEGINLNRQATGGKTLALR